MQNMTPAMDRIMGEVIASSNIMREDEVYAQIKKGMQAFVAELLRHENMVAACNSMLIDSMIAEIDGRIGAQLDEILHHDCFRRLESAWKGLKFLVERSDCSQNIEISLLDISRQELEDDFAEHLDITHTLLYRHAYAADYGQYGGHPVGAMVADYYFGPGSRDMEMVRKLAAVAALSHAPVLVGASPRFFGLASFASMIKVTDITANFHGPGFHSWNTFRESEDARYIGFVMPRFLLRLPYGEKGARVKALAYEETVGNHDRDLLWGNAVFAFASTLTGSFARYRWCPNIVGPRSGGQIRNLPEYVYESVGREFARIPTEIMISDRREYELSEQGFIPLVIRKNSNNACFFSANSAQKPKKFGASKEEKQAEMNHRLGTQLPYLFIVTRLAHYLKVMQRENVGAWSSSTQIQEELQTWLRQYISDQENPPAEVRSRRPLCAAEIVVTDVQGEPGKYDVRLRITPHFKYMGTDFTLSLNGVIDS